MKLVKSLIVAAVAAAVVVPTLSFAEASQPLTRAQVRHELIELEQAGYNPTMNDTQYPQDIQQAEARLHAKDAQAADANTVGHAGASGA
jgi:hypothetical protein